MFNSHSVEEAFIAWLTIGGGINPNPLDEERFFRCVTAYYENGEDVSKEAFVKECKKYTHTSRTQNYGICQKYYNRLDIIVRFLKTTRK